MRQIDISGRESRASSAWTLTSVLLYVLLTGCEHHGSNQASGAVRPPVVQTPEDDVYPQVLRGSVQMELGQLVLLLMPETSQPSVDWDYRANSPIKWQASQAFSRASDSDRASRTGWVRVNIEGRKATVLRERKFEFGWTVTYSNELSGDTSAKAQYQPVKLGVANIEIRPGGDGADSCFGTGFEGCEFDEPFTSLDQAGVHVQTICSKHVLGGFISSFLLTHPGRKPTVMTFRDDGGSGGRSSWINLVLDAGKDLTPDNDIYPHLYDPSLCGQD